MAMIETGGSLFGSPREDGTRVFHRDFRPTSSGPKLRYLCDGATTPNPGNSQPVAFDGSRFLKIRSTANDGSHRSVYEAIWAAFWNARRNRASEVEIHMFSTHVWGQLTGEQNVNRLEFHCRRTFSWARKFSLVTWVLVEPPVIIGGRTASTRRELRELARRTLAQTARAV